ncbi:hypothetical protein J1N35_016824 [Gossypium stocksii]|uniref:Uncharacterized protein n=1 Tax=Gossypium stocksii TaxID=47602 RepID=A0A9D3VM12_9ROSI|nr:hypothetical protein J1N35_016824 [Gossypium stocksii]
MAGNHHATPEVMMRALFELLKAKRRHLLELREKIANIKLWYNFPLRFQPKLDELIELCAAYDNRELEDIYEGLRFCHGLLSSNSGSMACPSLYMLASLSSRMDGCFAECIKKIDSLRQMDGWIYVGLSVSLFAESFSRHPVTDVGAYMDSARPIFDFESTADYAYGPFSRLYYQLKAYATNPLKYNYRGNLAFLLKVMKEIDAMTRHCQSNDGYGLRTSFDASSSSANPQSWSFTLNDPSTICPDIEAGTQHHTNRMLPDLHNRHPGGADTQSMSVISMTNTNLNYDTSNHSLRSTALRPCQGTASIDPSNHICLNHNTGTVSGAGISMPLLDNSPDHQRGFGNRLPVYVAGTQSQTQSPMAPLSNQPGHDAVITIPAAGEFASVLQTTHIEGRAIGDYETARHSRSNRDDGTARHARAIRDDEIAGHSKLFKTLVPVNFSGAYMVAGIARQIYQSVGLPLPVKLFGLLTVGFAFAAGFSSLVGLSISTIRPNSLPFGSNPRLMIRMMHNVVAHTTAYAFIWAMCHLFLQDDPLLMWIVAGLASVAFMIIIRRVNMG